MISIEQYFSDLYTLLPHSILSSEFSIGTLPFGDGLKMIKLMLSQPCKNYYLTLIEDALSI